MRIYSCRYCRKRFYQLLVLVYVIGGGNEALLNEEIRYSKLVFTEINEYPKHLVHNIVREELQNKKRSNEVNADYKEPHIMQILPYGGTKGSKL